MADRETALMVFDFLERLRVEKYRVGDSTRDIRTANMLASLSLDDGLRDAACMKLLSPGLERIRFLEIAAHDPMSLTVCASKLKTMWDQTDYDVSRMVNSEFNQDVAALLWQLSVHIQTPGLRRGPLEAASYLSFMQGDREEVVAKYLGGLRAVAPTGEVTRALMDAHVHGDRPAWIVQQAQDRPSVVTVPDVAPQRCDPIEPVPGEQSPVAQVPVESQEQAGWHPIQGMRRFVGL